VKHADYISIVKNQSLRLRYLVTNILLNADAALPVGQPISTNIVSSITTLIDYHKSQADKANISLIFHSAINQNVFVNLLADSDQIMFGNLIDNAIKYSPNNTKVTIELSTKNNDFIFCISDRGPGFKNLSHIGKKYYREISQIPGTGLGLSNVINCVNKSEGNCSISNNHEGGGEITITLPLSGSSTLSTNLETPPSPYVYSQLDFENFSNYKILLVEDDTNLTLLFKETLASQFCIQFCSNGQQAIQYLQEAKDELPEVIISDVMMPLMNGFELCEQVKRTDEFKHIPFLLLTAKSDSSSQQKGLSLGADDYINKPFEMKSLQFKVNNIINTNNARKKLQLNYITAQKSTEGSSNILDSNQHEFITQVRASLKTNLSNANYNIDDLANTQYMSTSTLRRKLKQFFDQTFTEILKKARINKAKKLLATDKQIQLIGESCGYSGHSYFTKHFKEDLGVSPKEFRAALRKNCTPINSI
jgi:DNA-binding response OmpR family regulator